MTIALRSRATAGRIEQVGDELPLLIGQGDRKVHGGQSRRRPCPLSWRKPGDPNVRIRLQTLRRSTRAALRTIVSQLPKVALPRI